MAGCERAKRASTESTRWRAGGLPPAGQQPLRVEHGCRGEGCWDRVQAALSAVARSQRPKPRNRCGTVRRGIGGNQEPPSERSERGNLLTGWVGCFLVVGLRRGIGGNQEPPSERSERGSVILRTRMRARVPRRRVRAIPLYIGVLGGFVVCFSV